MKVTSCEGEGVISDVNLAIELRVVIIINYVMLFIYS